VSAVAATTRLRFELLRSTVVYGVYSALPNAGDALMQEWLAYVRWVEGLFSTAAAEAGLSADGAQTPEWLDRMSRALEHPRESGDGDPFDAQELRDWTRVQFERLAETSRPLEQLAAEPLGEVEGTPTRAGMRLLAAMQDSLVLASVEEPEIRSERADAVEILANLVAARDEGVWDFVFGGWPERKTPPVRVGNQRLKTRGGEIVQRIDERPWLLGTNRRLGLPERTLSDRFPESARGSRLGRGSDACGLRTTLRRLGARDVQQQLARTRPHRVRGLRAHDRGLRPKVIPAARDGLDE
jgi:hypothetical protein